MMKHLILGTLVRSRWPMAASLTFVGMFLWSHWNRVPTVSLCIFLPIAVAAPMLVTFWPRTWTFSDTRRFPQRRSRRVILRCEPGVDKRLNLDLQMTWWEQALDEMEKQFGFSLRRRVLVIVYNSSAKAQRLVGRSWAEAVALFNDQVVVAGVDCLLRQPMETMRHELAHLFSAAWLSRPVAFPFRDEGVAVFLQRTVANSPVDRWARWVVRQGRFRPVTEMFRRTMYPEAARDAFDLYVLAGSFAGFLIRTYGWGRYRSFFGSVTIANHAKLFHRVFGVSLREAEAEWLERTLECSVLDTRIDYHLLNQHAALLRTVKQLGSRSATSKTVIDIPTRIAERRKQLYG